MPKCKVCSEPFESYRPMQKVCSWECAKSIAKVAVEKIEKAKIKVLKEKLKTRNEWLKEAQSAFNAYIRIRDIELPCISCGRHHTGQYHAGHYRSVGSAPNLRFDENNCHKQCQPCNTHLSGNIVLYRKSLLVKVGEQEVDRIESANAPGKWTIEEIKSIRQIYLAKYRQLKKAIHE